MGLEQVLRDAVKVAFTELDDIPQPITYVQVTDIGTYDPVTDTQVPTTVSTAVDAVLVNIREDEPDWTHVKGFTQKCLIPYVDLPIDPSENDYVTIDGVDWEIMKIKKVPTRAVHILFIRAP